MVFLKAIFSRDQNSVYWDAERVATDKVIVSKTKERFLIIFHVQCLLFTVPNMSQDINLESVTV